jgi:hypothetical protein
VPTDPLSDESKPVAHSGRIIDVEAIKCPDLVAQMVVENVAMQIERRVAFRHGLNKVSVGHGLWCPWESGSLFPFVVPDKPNQRTPFVLVLNVCLFPEL